MEKPINCKYSLAIFCCCSFRTASRGSTRTASGVSRDIAYIITIYIFFCISALKRKFLDAYSEKMFCNEVALQHDGKFNQFRFSPLCLFSSECHRRGEVRDYLLNVAVSGTVSVLGGIAAASAKYQREENASSEREVISLSSSVYTRKGFLVSGKETPTYVDNHDGFTVEGIEIGLEEILIVTTEVER